MHLEVSGITRLMSLSQNSSRKIKENHNNISLNANRYLTESIHTWTTELRILTRELFDTLDTNICSHLLFTTSATVSSLGCSLQD